jgi:hypothetical protein
LTRASLSARSSARSPARAAERPLGNRATRGDKGPGSPITSSASTSPPLDLRARHRPGARSSAPAYGRLDPTRRPCPRQRTQASRHASKRDRPAATALEGGWREGQRARARRQPRAELQAVDRPSGRPSRTIGSLRSPPVLEGHEKHGASRGDRTPPETGYSTAPSSEPSAARAPAAFGGRPPSAPPSRARASARTPARGASTAGDESRT